MIEWQWSGFAELAVTDLYEMLALRQQVFVLEQTCLFPDIDGLDPVAHHLLGWKTTDGKRELAAALRCLPPGVKYDEMSIGRVVTSQAARGTGLGRELVAQGIACATQLHPGQPIRIDAQAHLQAFYAAFGFQTVSEPYDEDGIMHVYMLRPAA